jgi:biopolymer transport protein ExbD
MAEVTTSQDSRRKPIRIDMTPMVDLAFLLVTFFMLTTTLSKPKIMKLTMPEKTPNGGLVPEEVTTTLVLDKDDRIFYYRGADDPEIAETSYASDGLRKMAQEMVRKAANLKKDAVFIIKPTSEASYQNVVDVLDEMKITNVQVYTIQQMYPQEKDLLKTYKLAHSIP